MTSNNLVLRPNCLLTKYPVIFITGTRSLFHAKPLAEPDLLHFLREHGYLVYCPPMAFRSKAGRSDMLKNWLEQLQAKKIHLILSHNTYSEFKHIWPQFNIESTTFVTHIPKIQIHLTTTMSLKYKLHELFLSLFKTNTCSSKEAFSLQKTPQLYDAVLDHLINLAENEDL